MSQPEPETQGTQVHLLDDALWERFLELSQGAAAPCYQCGTCTAACPWGWVRSGGFSVREVLRRAQLGLLPGDPTLWLCTACAQCEATCPRDVPIVEVMRAMRQVLWERRQVLAGLPTVLWSVCWNGNPWSQPPSARAQWAQGLDLPRFDAAQHEILLFVGCTGAYERRAQRIVRSLVRVLQAAGVAFGVLGDEEPCCGEAVLSLGHRPYFDEIALGTARLLHSHGVGEVVTVSPHAFDVFHNHYPRLNAGFRALHYTQLLARLIEDGRLPFAHAVEEATVFHDPCLLARTNGIYEAPREVLNSIPGLSLTEMERHGVDGLCCGGGGGRMWMETPAGERFSDLRVQEAAEAGASVIATACPYCVICLEDSLKVQKHQTVKVLDVAELAALAIGDGG